MSNLLSSLTKKAKERGDFIVGSSIISGAWSTVYRCKVKDACKQKWSKLSEEQQNSLAIKIIPCYKSDKHKVTAENEEEVVRLIPRDKGLVKVYDYFRHSTEKGEELCIVMEYMGGGEVGNLVGLFSKPSEETVKRVMLGATSGMKALHSRNLVHQDIKKENLLLDTSVPARTKIADYGSVHRITKDKPQPEVPEGTFQLFSPERIRYLLRYFMKDFTHPTQESKDHVKFVAVADKKGDVFSLGIVAVELATAQEVFEYEGYSVNSYTSILKEMYDGHLIERIEQTNWSEKGKQWLKGMLELHPERRFTTEQAYGHEWLRSDLDATITQSPTQQGTAPSRGRTPRLLNPGSSKPVRSVSPVDVTRRIQEQKREVVASPKTTTIKANTTSSSPSSSNNIIKPPGNNNNNLIPPRITGTTPPKKAINTPPKRTATSLSSSSKAGTQSPPHIQVQKTREERKTSRTSVSSSAATPTPPTERKIQVPPRNPKTVTPPTLQRKSKPERDSKRPNAAS